MVYGLGPLVGTAVAAAVPAIATESVFVGLGLSALSIGGQIASSAAMVGTGLLLGPLGWICVGADADGASFDCWKPVVRETSTAPSQGRRLVDLLTDPRVKEARVQGQHEKNFRVYVTNVWDEVFTVYPVQLANGTVAAHAEKV
jgi:hypothetical protein